MIDIKVMKEIAEKSKEAVDLMTLLQTSKHEECYVWEVMSAMEDYDYLCAEIKKLVSEN